MASQRVYRFSRPALWRIAAALFISFFVLAPAVAEAKALRAYAGIVMDAKTGKVLYQSDADAYRYPASVTKVMTLYILFQELDAGRIKLSDKMPVSKWAASAQPTKLGLKAGSSISVDNAIKSIVTISANDMARVIAEYIGGSESGFARRMTSTARALGMSHTTYVNASGLPDGRQITTVRDQALLGAAVFEHFPQYYRYFQTASFKYGKRTYRGHDNLLGHNGIDGLKTGYTGSSGYNLLTAARKDGRHIVVAGFGFASGGKRDAKVRDLVDTYLPKASSGDYLKTAMIPMPGRKGSPVPDDGVRVASADNAAVLPLPAPAFRLVDGEDVVAPDDPQSGIGDVDNDLTVATLAPQPAGRPMDLGMPPALQAVEKAAPTPSKRKKLGDVVGAFTDNYSLGAAPAALGQTRPSAPLIPPVGIGSDGQPVDLMTSGSISTEAAVVPVSDVAPVSLGLDDTQVAEAPPVQQMPASLPQGWIVQIGASPTSDGANGLIGDASDKVRSLSKFQGFVERFEKEGQTYFRARFGGFSGQGAANDMCKQLKQAKMSCLAMQS